MVSDVSTRHALLHFDFTNNRKENKMAEGTYYGVARKTSPWSILATFWSREWAERWIAKQNHPDQFRVVEF